MTGHDRISIALATYNGGRYVRQQLDSIQHQTHQDFIIHVCDDGSRDDTLEVIRSHELYQQGKIRLYPGEGGQGAMKNFRRTIACCEDHYIALCDQDDYWVPEKLERQLKEVKAHEQGGVTPVLAFSDLEIVDAVLGPLHPSFYRASIKSSAASQPEDFVVSNHIPGCAMLFNRALKQLMEPMPDDIRMHDWWIALIAAHSGKIAYVDMPLIKYRQHGNNTVGVPGILRKRLLPDSLLCLRGYPTSQKHSRMMLTALKNFCQQHPSDNTDFLRVVRGEAGLLSKLLLMRRARNGERKLLSCAIWWMV
ncbi:glycosyltransferase family 2 protein [Dickeya dianthicola]|uniref:glycosyltransferase family 2 protein n=1 Tax=Dickeya dianthicola TaxID=204039 RepID=UPI001371ADBC|nr:glycosyltransferase family 2 protein [Dickeya dianthicola]MCI4238931.1 glycosyltransferase family 2 protein [Dickeya dianthicola]MCI4254284.1 glycosyltransferase family 2 protein [Dickeya dianthicola]MZG20287.1 glycosyltransferase family 2 protein [Dickeya dianthicola]MZI88870.1 glycosyltransferase family 2 protein [Dickeya dianthicola]